MKVGDLVRGNTINTFVSNKTQRGSVGIITHIGSKTGAITLVWLSGLARLKGIEMEGFCVDELEVVNENR
jgi:hypothetical protein